MQTKIISLLSLSMLISATTMFGADASHGAATGGGGGGGGVGVAVAAAGVQPAAHAATAPAAASALATATASSSASHSRPVTPPGVLVVPAAAAVSVLTAPAAGSRGRQTSRTATESVAGRRHGRNMSPIREAINFLLPYMKSNPALVGAALTSLDQKAIKENGLQDTVTRLVSANYALMQRDFMDSELLARLAFHGTGVPAVVGAGGVATGPLSSPDRVAAAEASSPVTLVLPAATAAALPATTSAVSTPSASLATAPATTATTTTTTATTTTAIGGGVGAGGLASTVASPAAGSSERGPVGGHVRSDAESVVENDF